MISPVQNSPFLNYSLQNPLRTGIKRCGKIKDEFQPNLEYITSVEIFKKHLGNLNPIHAQIYKKEGHNCAKYYIKRNDDLLGILELDLKGGDTFVSTIESFKRHKYKGVGTMLLQLAVEESLKKSKNATVTLNAQKLHFAQRAPHKFYEKLGFKTLKATEEELRTYGTPMILYSLKSGFWRKKLEQNRLLKDG